METFHQPGTKSDTGGERWRGSKLEHETLLCLAKFQWNVCWNNPVKGRHTSHDLERVQRYLRGGVIGCPLYRGVQHSVHHRDFGVIEDETCEPQTDTLKTKVVRVWSKSGASLVHWCCTVQTTRLPPR